jgi:tetratricopeptide (TPR) repeat protein
MKNNCVRKSCVQWSLLSVAAVGGSLVGCVTKTQPSSVTNTIPDMKDPSEPKPNAPISANTRFAAGTLAEQQGDLPRAATQYEAALKLEPTAPATLMRLGMVYTSMQQFDKAIATWHRYIKATNNSAAGYCNLGLTQELAQHFSESESAFKSAVAADPKNEPARVNYGLMLARQGRLDDAMAQLQAVLTPAESHYDIASVLESQGKTSLAKSQYREALRSDPDMNDAKSRLAALDTDDQ